MKRVLIIDDDEGILDAIAFILEDAGYDVQTTAKADEVIDKTTSLHPDIIVLDVLLSGKDGRVICRELKQQRHSRHIPVIMISALPGAESTIREFGADDFLAKPFDTTALLETVEKYAH